MSDAQLRNFTHDKSTRHYEWLSLRNPAFGSFFNRWLCREYLEWKVLEPSLELLCTWYCVNIHSKDPCWPVCPPFVRAKKKERWTIVGPLAIYNDMRRELLLCGALFLETWLNRFHSHKGILGSFLGVGLMTSCVYECSVRTFNWGLGTFWVSSLSFIVKRSDSKARSTMKGFSLFKVLHHIGYQSDKLWMWLFNRARNQRLEFTHFQTAEKLKCNLSVYGALWEKAVLAPFNSST